MAQTLTVMQMYALARKAGLSPGNAVVAAAVGEAESSGRTAVTSANPDGGTNVGPWQIDTRGVGAGYTVAQLQDPAVNAQAMAKGSKNGTNWGPWATYASGAYQQYMAAAGAASLTESLAKASATPWYDTILQDAGIAWNATAGKAVSAVTRAAGQVLQLPPQVTGFFESAGSLLSAAMWLADPAHWLRIFAGLFGVLLAGAGLYTLAKAA